MGMSHSPGSVPMRIPNSQHYIEIYLLLGTTLVFSPIESLSTRVRDPEQALLWNSALWA